MASKMFVTEKSVDEEKFMEFVESRLLPILPPFDGKNYKSVVIMGTMPLLQVCLRAKNGIKKMANYLPYLAQCVL